MIMRMRHTPIRLSSYKLFIRECVHHTGRWPKLLKMYIYKYEACAVTVPRPRLGTPTILHSRAASLCSAAAVCAKVTAFHPRGNDLCLCDNAIYLSLNAYDPQLTLAGRGPELNMRLNMVMAWHFFFWLFLYVRACLCSS
jgi:hypothetical protein